MAHVSPRSADEPAASTPVRRGPTWWKWLRDPAFLVALATVILILGIAILAPLLAPYDPMAQSLATRLVPPAWQSDGSLSHILGTDSLGRDVLSRLLYGTRSSMTVAVVVVGCSAVVGCTLGLIAGTYGGWVEEAIMRLTDVMLAFPGLLMTMAIIIMMGAGTGTMIIALLIRSWMVYARVARAQVLALRGNDFITAARSLGASQSRIMFKHLLPNMYASIFTLTVLEFARTLLAESALSFLGFGIQPPGISWGLMLAEGRNYLFVASWLVVYPGLSLAAASLSCNVVAVSLRTMVDPLQAARRTRGENTGR